MSRRDTMLEEAHRVRVLRPDGAWVAGGQFSSLEDARGYYDAVYVPGARKELQRRPAGKSRYETIELLSMGEARVPDDHSYDNYDEDGSPLDADNDPDT